MPMSLGTLGCLGTGVDGSLALAGRHNSDLEARARVE